MNSSKPISRLYLNQDLEMHVFSMQSAFMPEEGLSFKLNVQYYSELFLFVSCCRRSSVPSECGGMISEPSSGVITSPNFGDGRPYLSNSHCLWMLTAPEGMVVKVSSVFSLFKEWKKSSAVVGMGHWLLRWKTSAELAWFFIYFSGVFFFNFERSIQEKWANSNLHILHLS